ncbi:phosphoglycerate dehydrogenase [bacterium]|nr:phosphoglycerate dehydrogenase [bacterium]
MKVLVTDKCNDIAREIVSEVAQVDVLPTMTEDEYVENIGKYDALIIRSASKITKKIIDAADNLKIIGRAGVGVDNIDVDAATQKGIIVVNSPDGNTNAAAEHTIAMMLAMVRNIPNACQSTKEGKWDRAKFTGVEVFGKTLGVIGLGKIGSHVAKVALALGMKVVVYDPYTSENAVKAIGADYVADLNNFWGVCDFITVHVPKTKETVNLINKDTIAKMKDGVRLVNCARGGIINEEDLREALDKGKVAGAAIDVYCNEPDIQSCPLYGCEKNVLMTPHLGASTSEAQINVAVDVAKQIKEVLSGGSATSAVNIPSLKPAVLEPVKDYMTLAQNVGELADQVADGNLKSIELNFKGNLASLDVSPLETAILKGVFSASMQGVNFVNAPIIAKNKGIDVSTVKTATSGDYIGSVTVKLTTDKETVVVSGALIAKGVKRIVKVNDFNTSIEPEEHMLLVPHENKPSMIAKVSTVIGEANININHMSVSPNEEKNLSMMVIAIGSEVDAETLAKINEIDGIQHAKYVHLGK